METTDVIDIRLPIVFFTKQEITEYQYTKIYLNCLLLKWIILMNVSNKHLSCIIWTIIFLNLLQLILDVIFTFLLFIDLRRWGYAE